MARAHNIEASSTPPIIISGPSTSVRSSSVSLKVAQIEGAIPSAPPQRTVKARADPEFDDAKVNLKEIRTEGLRKPQSNWHSIARVWIFIVIPCGSILVLLHLCFFHGTLRQWPNDNEQDGLAAVSHGVGMHPGGVEAPVAFVGNGNEQEASGEKEEEMRPGVLNVQAGKDDVVGINEDLLVEIEVGSE